MHHRDLPASARGRILIYTASRLLFISPLSIIRNDRLEPFPAAAMHFSNNTRQAFRSEYDMQKTRHRAHLPAQSPYWRNFW